jgi:hypothetical protein
MQKLIAVELDSTTVMQPGAIPREHNILDVIEFIARYLRTYDLCRLAVCSRVAYALLRGVIPGRFVTVRRLADVFYVMLHVASEHPDANCLVYTNGAAYVDEPISFSYDPYWHSIWSRKTHTHAIYMADRGVYAELRRYVRVMERQIARDTNVGRRTIAGQLMDARPYGWERHAYVYESDLEDVLEFVEEMQQDVDVDDPEEDGLPHEVVSPPIRIPREYIVEVPFVGMEVNMDALPEALENVDVEAAESDESDESSDEMDEEILE